MLSLALVIGLVPQEPQAAPAVADRSVAVWTDAQARTALADFRKAFGAKGARLVDRLAAVEALAGGSHKSLVRPLCDVVHTDEAVTVRKAAAQALADQPAKEGKPAVRRLLEDKNVTDSGPVAAVLVQSLAKLGYQPSDWKLLEDLFRANYDQEHVPLQQAVILLAKEQKEPQALDLLLAHLDEPVPANPDAPDNPPAEWWEMRWKAWRVWRGDIGEALFAITGQRFTTAAEARTWLKKNPLPKRR